MNRSRFRGRRRNPLSPSSRRQVPRPCPAEPWWTSAGSKNLLFSASRNRLRETHHSKGEGQWVAAGPASWRLSAPLPSGERDRLRSSGSHRSGYACRTCPRSRCARPAALPRYNRTSIKSYNVLWPSLFNTNRRSALLAAEQGVAWTEATRRSPHLNNATVPCLGK